MIRIKSNNKIKTPDFSYEESFYKNGLIVAGVDEVGRGCLAGPVVAAAVIFQKSKNNYGINDSKILTEKKRNELFELIKDHSISISVGFSDNQFIDKYNILNSTFHAMHIAINNLSHKPDHVLIDGNRYKSDGISFTTIINGDAKSISIAAASIIAKVARDKWMCEIADNEYPEYGFAKHKGYGTKYHFEMIDKFGVCEIHRRSFLKKFLSGNDKLF